MDTDTVYIKFFTGVTENSVKALMNVIDQKLGEGVRKFTILVSSGGGNVYSGISAYNYLKGIPAEVNTHNFGTASSVALVLFCAGKKRYSVPHGVFLMHGVQTNFPKETSLEEKQLEERLLGLKLDVENIAGIIATESGKNEDEVMGDISERKTLNPEDAVKYGLVHEIKEELFEEGAELISIH